eukprot:gnl/TRDRNA2_/TRDRNA2_91165_c0_seq1.p1 gnl/TRDRNA2_/TRDRNA2_91165_c0~~gnl/TRDRNA2_/TRDRNA2_91165_c0_seq1.p1  ORF type:complete len:368 (+),score=37.08 gnl/TRDRNA2_/TRDRNA2_91165_c0_seq1:62-1165(+)
MLASLGRVVSQICSPCGGTLEAPMESAASPSLGSTAVPRVPRPAAITRPAESSFAGCGREDEDLGETHKLTLALALLSWSALRAAHWSGQQLGIALLKISPMGWVELWCMLCCYLFWVSRLRRRSGKGSDKAAETESARDASGAHATDTLLRDSMLEIRGSDGDMQLANTQPVQFDTEWVKGTMLVGVKTEPLAPSCKQLFEGSKSRRWFGVQIRIVFKKVPDGAHSWHFAGEIDGPANLPASVKILANVVLAIIKLWNSAVEYSLGGDGCPNAFMSSPLDLWVDVDGPIVPGTEYVWETGSCYADLERWQAIDIPSKGRTVPLSLFWGKRDLRMILFAREGKSRERITAAEFQFHWRGHASGGHEA